MNTRSVSISTIESSGAWILTERLWLNCGEEQVQRHVTGEKLRTLKEAVDVSVNMRYTKLDSIVPVIYILGLYPLAVVVEELLVSLYRV